MKEIKIGLIGLGGMANVHLEQMAKLEGVHVTAICDSNAQAVEQAGDKLNIAQEHRYADYADLIADDEVDAILSITPNNVHYEIVKCCLLHKKPFMTEKPFTRTYEEALELFELYETDPIPSMVGFSYRYVPSFRYARDLIREGKLGAIRSVFVQYLQSWGVSMVGTPMNWRYQSSITGTGALADLGSHMVDAARFMIGEFTEVTAQMKTFISKRHDPATGSEGTVDVDDFTGFLATLEGDVAGVFQTSRNAYGSGNQLEVTIYGDLGTLSVSCERGNELTWIRPQAESGDPSLSVTGRHQVPAPYAVTQMQDFADMLRGSVRDELPGLQDGYANQEVLEAIAQAASLKRTIAPADIRTQTRTAEGVS
ncbi:oxidoreductase [Paenibacillus baekrokdamisoli]|uniref:Oxidoreductase n=1 Tax=Paenibacillus baekrokdamisoli TaxID=1712516 RepID=A0A3G9JBP4_9BACL|nr:Gfo/Idh/MocA family oxidoreductase [Paenibacillus baekrokdamisoli]MBB3070293.1 putative dehydrogenase [Paenibacillus baekrokdamisoli]BBH21298.1 oxidoreductase [Paenibacillus baekrokdamisoli]